MPIREHIKQQTQIEPIFFAPLTSDLQDKVSNRYMSVFTGTVNRFSSDRGAEFDGRSGLILDAWSFDGDNTKPLVLLFDYIKISNSGHGTAVDIRPTSGAYNFAFSYNAPNNSMDAIWTTGWASLTNSNLYVTNGVQYKNSGIYYNPSNSTLNKIIEGVIVKTKTVTTYPATYNLDFRIGAPHYNGDRWYGYIRNVRLYLNDFSSDMLIN